MAKKDKKAKETEKKARKAKKQDKSEKKNAEKAKSRNKEVDEDDDDVDLDQVLAEYARQQESFLKVTEEICEPPSARGSATIIASPDNNHELLLFGGEYFNGSLARFFNDLFLYNIKRDEWRRVTSPNTPLPRSGHAWSRGGNARGIYLFAGEFSSPKQGTFYHYNDFWRLEPSSREWTKLESKGKEKSPPARSGHRMTFYKNYIILFGGFQDTSQQTKYLQDLWLYDCASFTWHCPSLPPASQRPDARSSFTFLPHESGAVLYGGYSRVKASATPKASKNGSLTGTSHSIMKPVVHQDTWYLRVTPTGSDAHPGVSPSVRWERRKRPANAPNPPRAGATMAYHRGRGIQFGGVHDIENSEEGIDSEFFSNLLVWNVDRNRFFPLSLRRPKTSQKKPQAADRGKRGKAKADEEELLRNLAALEAKDTAAEIKDEHNDDQNQNQDGDSGDSKPIAWEMPHPRFNSQLTVQDDVVYIFGGTFEKGDREYTFDELWAIDLGKLDGAKEIFRRELEDWVVSDEEDSDGEDDSGSDTEGASEEGDDLAEEHMAPGDSSQKVTQEPETATDPADGTEESQTSESALTDALPHPRPFETLRDFFSRTTDSWQDLLIAEAKGISEVQPQTIKEVRKKAFELAEGKWWDCREEVRTLEDEQESAGIGEIVSLSEKQEQSSGGGRRR